LRLFVTVTPGANRSEVVAPHGEGWKMRVTAAPERGRANDALAELIACALDVPRGSVRIVSGHTTRRKVIEVEGITEPQARHRLLAAAHRPR